MKHFYRLLVNTLIANVTTSFLWFALTFWVYLETKNVMATAILGGSYMLMLAVTGLFFGTLVDRFHKKHVMTVASAITALMYGLGGAIYVFVPHEQLLTIGSPWFWLFTTIILCGCIVENSRNIALSTCVTIMVPEDRRANANGLVGMVQGLAFMITSIFSGLAIGYLGMGWTLVISIALTLFALIDLLFVTINEKQIIHDPKLQQKLVDFRGAWSAIRAVPGLLALILFATFNNLVGGVFMTLLDPYGLTLTSVQMWGFVYAISSLGFMVGGALVAKMGLGKNPLRVLLLGNVVVGIIGFVMGIRESLWLLAVSMFAYMSTVPVIEAAEQTTLQKIVPLKKQGRVFGFGQSVEAAASPVSAYMIGPIAQLWIIPYMASPEGKATWGWLVGQGEARGMALVFMGASLIMLIAALMAFRSRAYTSLTHKYRAAQAGSN
ncbi:MFS transporter [Candidatus Saccharibacteria bacterium]|nr:MAG: MFS transporter [Candidatus Saccharibacteria bacterium]